MLIRPLLFAASLALVAAPAQARDTASIAQLLSLGPDGVSASDLQGAQITGADGILVSLVQDVVLLGQGLNKAIVDLDAFSESRARTVLILLDDLSISGSSNEVLSMTAEPEVAKVDALIDYDAS